MDPYDDILQSTGGLPPSAFTLQPDNNTSTIGEFDDLLAQTPALNLDYPSRKIAHGQDDIIEDGIGAITVGILAQLSPNSKEPDSSKSSSSSLFSSPVETSTSTPSSDNLQRISPSPNHDQSINPGRKKFVMPDSAKSILEQIFSEEPYPSPERQNDLSEATGLTPQQVKTWFNNARSRRLKRATKEHDPRESLEKPSNHLSLTRSSLKMIRDCQSDDSFAMDRFLDTPFEEYPFNLYEVERAASQLDSFGLSWNSRIRVEPYMKRSSDARSNPSSCSSNSSSSIHSFNSFDNRQSRRGRRKLVNETGSQATVDKPFYCTFCPKVFSGRYEWNRHEESIHFPTILWVCEPELAHQQIVKRNGCIYCGNATMSKGHLEEHNYSKCKRQSESARTFYRRDHLQQHIQTFHQCEKQWAASISHRSARHQYFMPKNPSHPTLHCGFCGFHALTWNDRVSHLTEHFRQGVDMKEWWLRRKSNNITVQDYKRLQRTCDCNNPYTDTYLYWSCSFLPSAKLAFNFLSNHVRECQFCGSRLFENYHSAWTKSVRHLATEHNYRSCDQPVFTCRTHFLEHLTKDHSRSLKYDEFNLLMNYERIVQLRGFHEDTSSLYVESATSEISQIPASSQTETGNLNAYFDAGKEDQPLMIWTI